MLSVKQRKMKIKDLTTQIGFIGGRDAIIIEHINIINSRTIEIYVDVANNNLCSFFDETKESYKMKFGFVGVVYYSLLNYEMFEKPMFDSLINIDTKNLIVKTDSISCIQEIIGSSLSENELHHIVITAYDDIIEIVCKEFTNEAITDNNHLNC